MNANSILVINDFCYVNGGAASVAIEGAVGLAANGIRVGFVGMCGPVDLRLRNALGELIWCAEKSSFLDSPSRVKSVLSGWWNTEVAGFLDSAFVKFPPDRTLVHVHGWMKAFSPSLFSVLQDRGYTVVVTLHDYFIACPNGGFLVYPKATICKRRPLSVSCLICDCDSRSYPQKLWRFGRGVIQNYLTRVPSKVSGFIGVSHFALGKLHPYLPGDVLRTVVRNPIAVNPRPGFQFNCDGPILFIGRLSKEKGPGLAAQAARALRHRIIFVGDGDEKQELSLEYPEAEFVGWQSREAVLALMLEASCLVFPSLWYETNGMVVLEAMASGLPVVVADETAPTEFVLDGITGRLFKSGCSESLAHVVGEILSGQGNELSAAAYKWYWDAPWTLANHVSELLDFYDTVWEGEDGFSNTHNRNA